MDLVIYIYIYRSNIVERFKLKKCKHEKSWLVQLATETKRRINEIVKYFPIYMNMINTKEYLNIIPLGSYYYLISMDLLEKHHVVLDFYNKAFTCLDEEEKSMIVQGIPRIIFLRAISSLHLKRSFREGC